MSRSYKKTNFVAEMMKIFILVLCRKYLVDRITKGIVKWRNKFKKSRKKYLNSKYFELKLPT